MSMDFGDYERLREKNKWLSFVWMVGDRIYYIGLIGGVLLVVAAVSLQFVRNFKDIQVGIFLFNKFGLVMYGACIVGLLTGPLLKRWARVKRKDLLPESALKNAI